MIRALRLLSGAIVALLAAGSAAAEALRFGVLNQRSPQLIAQYWNPILEYVGRKSGYPLELRIAKSAPETTALAVRGELDFYYTNHLFTTERDKLGWRVFGRSVGEQIRAEIVVAETSTIQTLADLRDRHVAFPSPEAFVGYWVPMDALLAAGVKVRPLFAGNQEGAMAHLRVGAAAAAGVNAKVMASFARRENLRYRAIWSSEPYFDLALMAHPRVPQQVVEAMRTAFVGMAQDAEGARILESSAELIRLAPPFGFVAAENRDYDNYRQFYRNTRVRPGEP